MGQSRHSKAHVYAEGTRSTIPTSKLQDSRYSLRVQEDPAAILDIKEDIREECAKVGEVTNVVLFDKEADGVASVRFGNEVAAKACVRVRITSPQETHLLITPVDEMYLGHGRTFLRRNKSRSLYSRRQREIQEE